MEEEDPSHSLISPTIGKHRIVDVYETSQGYIVLTDNGRELILEKNVGEKLYWEIKERNRRRAFGL
jgi:S-adenosylmethionine hydrolase